MQRIAWLVFVVCAAAAWQRPAHAWGNNGHRIVCRIAYTLLDSKEQTEVDRLTGLYRLPNNGTPYTSFPEACLFADVARENAQDGIQGWTYFSRFERWHFLNLPRDARAVTAEHCGDNCVLKGIDYHSARLANKTLEEWKRAEALFFLGHWIGDIHQPLHISYVDDRGGNFVQPITGNYYLSANLHAVWDSGIISNAQQGGWWGYAARLKDGITPAQRTAWLSASPLEWAQESYAITTTDAVDYCRWEKSPEGVDSCNPEAHTRKLTEVYQDRFDDVVAERLQQAGVRLAARIRAALAINP